MKNIIIVGSGIVGTTLAYHLAKAGHRVDVFESGPATPYPHHPQYQLEVLYSNRYADFSGRIPPPLPEGFRGLSQSGDYPASIDQERLMCVGGMATRWFGIATRFTPVMFQPRTHHGYGSDWPLSYRQLESYYCRAEEYMAVSGSATDNPFAPPRSRKYPLPPFELGYYDRRLAEKLRAGGLFFHTTPQARTRHKYDGRPQCENFGFCAVCPSGARYSPNHHLNLAIESGNLTLHTATTVRRVVVENNRARAIVYYDRNSGQQREKSADVIVVAAGGIESARLLLLSKNGGIHRHGIGNSAGLVGKNLMFHHIWWGHMTFAEKMMPGRAGPPTLLSHQFIAPPGVRAYGGMTVELFDDYFRGYTDGVARKKWRNGAEIVRAMQPLLNSRVLTFNAETVPSDRKYLDLSGPVDRFGDPFAHVNYQLTDFDYATYAKATAISKQIADVLDARSVEIAAVKQFWSAHHHLGTCRMGKSARDSVVDSFGTVHDTRGLYVCGGSTFVTATSIQPTLTMVALAIRSADHIAEALR
ncbi:GMC family oxidoreductase [Brenneria tiliae]|uniref:GMC family oxidoreductase n=1 Tax=Brenneria tiliae TaxID=2914984 RepID=A0ABT0MYX9_9GAMM|nr:GMC family oxidoreductase [Brenneria tiliae]MCL2894757.1 GMC family oxidoreductase [Brenneria tiliae]